MSEQCDALHKLIGEGWMLIDVRTTFEYEQGHLPGALNVPMTELDGLKGDNFLVYCRTGARSHVATGFLLQKEIKAINIGGMLDLAKCFGPIH